MKSKPDHYLRHLTLQSTILQADKPVVIQAFIPELAVETLYVSVLGWFARFDEM